MVMEATSQKTDKQIKAGDQTLDSEETVEARDQVEGTTDGGDPLMVAQNNRKTGRWVLLLILSSYPLSSYTRKHGKVVSSV